jgi:hypothetical protein
MGRFILWTIHNLLVLQTNARYFESLLTTILVMFVSLVMCFISKEPEMFFSSDMQDMSNSLISNIEQAEVAVAWLFGVLLLKVVSAGFYQLICTIEIF